MRLWTPSREDPELLAWWGPLLMVARLAREDEVPWPIHIDEFDLVGRVDRGERRLPIWVYRHHRSSSDLYADATGQTYRYRQTPNAAAPGRFDRCELRASIHRAGLPDAVEPLTAERWAHKAWDDGDELEPLRSGGRGSASGRHRRTRSRVAPTNRWLHAVPSLPA